MTNIFTSLFHFWWSCRSDQLVSPLSDFTNFTMDFRINFTMSKTLKTVLWQRTVFNVLDMVKLMRNGERHHCIRAWILGMEGELPCLNAKGSCRMKCLKRHFKRQIFCCEKDQWKRCCEQEPGQCNNDMSLLHWPGSCSQSIFFIDLFHNKRSVF